MITFLYRISLHLRIFTSARTCFVCVNEINLIVLHTPCMHIIIHGISTVVSPYNIRSHDLYLLAWSHVTLFPCGRQLSLYFLLINPWTVSSLIYISIKGQQNGLWTVIITILCRLLSVFELCLLKPMFMCCLISSLKLKRKSVKQRLKITSNRTQFSNLRYPTPLHHHLANRCVLCC